MGKEEVDSIRVVLVDDDCEWLSVLSRLLEKKGFTVVATFTSSRRALGEIVSLYRGGCINLIISDFYMPYGYDGVELFFLLQERGVRVPFLIMSSDMAEDVRTSLLGWGLGASSKDPQLIMDEATRLFDR